MHACAHRSAGRTRARDSKLDLGHDAASMDNRGVNTGASGDGATGGAAGVALPPALAAAAASGLGGSSSEGMSESESDDLSVASLAIGGVATGAKLPLPVGGPKAGGAAWAPLLSVAGALSGTAGDALSNPARSPALDARSAICQLPVPSVIVRLCLPSRASDSCTSNPWSTAKRFVRSVPPRSDGFSTSFGANTGETICASSSSSRRRYVACASRMDSGYDISGAKEPGAGQGGHGWVRKGLRAGKATRGLDRESGFAPNNNTRRGECSRASTHI